MMILTIKQELCCIITVMGVSCGDVNLWICSEQELEA